MCLCALCSAPSGVSRARGGAAGGRRGRARCHVTGARWPRSRGEAPGAACAPRGGLGGLRVPHGWVRAAVMLGDPRSRAAKAGAATAVPEGKVGGLSARGVGAVRPEGTGTPAGRGQPGRCRGSSAQRCSLRHPRVQIPFRDPGVTLSRAGGTALLRDGAAVMSRGGARRPLASRYFPYNKQEFPEPRWFSPGCCHGACPARSM